MNEMTGQLPATILIANRGEIAVRISRTCRALGIRSVAVCSVADADSVHISACDEAVCLEGLAPGEAYLDGDRIIAVAQVCGADAIHPGYGFLSENADFAQACADAGLVFIGPDPSIIARMGDKIAAKAFAEAAGVPIVPGISDDAEAESGERRDARLIQAASALPFPLLVKASAGGGGRGMRVVDDPADLPQAIALARREAQNAFGSDRLLVERYITTPRHVEVQIFGDRHGNVVHLHERDCTVQRRHQKLIEEAPAPGLSDETRHALHEAAVALARAARYDNAGTVEFVFDAQTQEFFFLEVNTRLQVEHPVTEAILGLDLVAWQILAASGQPLPLSQADIRPRGWAIEARIVAEDAADSFRPQTGRIVKFQSPSGPGVRLDGGIKQGGSVSPYYDSMLAKVIAHGGDREVAVSRLRQALDATTVLGVANNVFFLRDLLGDAAFGTACHTTHFAETFVRDWAPGEAGRGEDEMFAHAAACFELAEQLQKPCALSPWSSLGAWRAGGAEAWRPRRAMVLEDEAGRLHRYWVRAGAGQIEIEAIGVDEAWSGSFAIERARDRLIVTRGDQRFDFAASVEEGDMGSLSVWLQSAAGSVRLNHAIGLHAWRRTQETGAGGDGRVHAPGPGLVVSVAVSEGESVEAGAPLVVIESMKMLTTVTSPRQGIIADVVCAPGQAIAKGGLLVALVDLREEED